MASESSLRRQQDSSKDSSSTQRSAWSTALIHLEKENPIRGMNELLPNATYIDAGVSIEEKALSALAAITQKPVTNQKATWGTRRNVYEATKEEISNLNPKGAGIGYRYCIFIDDDQPVSSMDEEYVNVLKEIGLDVNAEWITFTVISRGMPCPVGKQPYTLNPVLEMAISPDSQAIVVYGMWKEYDLDGDNLPAAAPISDLIHSCYIGFTQGPSALRYFITHPIYQKGTKQVLEDSLKAKSLKKNALATCLPSDPRNYAGHLPNPWHGLLGTRHGRIALFLLADHAEVYGKAVVKVQGYAVVGKKLYGSLILELGSGAIRGF